MKTPLALILLLFPLFVAAQKYPIYYGKLSKEEKAIEKTDLDPDANAIILGDYGLIEFDRGDIIFIRHVRIKILNQRGLDEANVEIPFVSQEGYRSTLDIKGQTLNIDEKGKVKKTKIKRKEFYTININKDFFVKRFAFPNVKPGSIIEYRFELVSNNFFSLEQWDFQNRLPTLKSQINTKIPDYLEYGIVLNGKLTTEKFRGKTQSYWFLENIPPLKDEIFCPNSRDYIESIQFQLAGFRGRNGLEAILPTWKDLAKEILETKFYKDILDEEQEADKIIKKIISEEDSQRDKIKKIYQYVQEHTQWNESFSMWAQNDFFELLKKDKLPSSDINLFLVRLLRSAGFDANPMIISTRSNGLVAEVYPLVTQFNQVLAHITLYGKDLIMDATSKYRPYNLLSIESLTPMGFLLSEKPHWINSPYPPKSKTAVSNEMKFEEDEMIYNVTYSFQGHKAEKYRRLYEQEDGQNSFVTKYLTSNIEELELDSFQVKNLKNLNEKFYVTCQYKKEIETETDAAFIYIEPLLKKHFEKNPFIAEHRTLPIDLEVPSQEKFVLNLEIPEGYELAETAEGKKLVLQDKKATYQYSIKELMSGKIQVISQLKINDPFYYPEEYAAIQDFFNQVVIAQSNQLILKKK